MAKLFVLMFVWGPALLGYALGWLIPHPTDWTGPAVVAPVGLAITALTYRWGLRRHATSTEDVKPYFVVGMVAGALVGVVIFGMLALGVIH